MRLHLRGFRSLSAEIALVYTLLSIALVVLLSYIAYRMNSSVLEERIRQDLLFTVDQAVRGINAHIEERAREVQTLSLTPALRAAAKEGARRTEALGLESAEESEVARILGPLETGQGARDAEAFLRELKEGHPYIAEVFVTDRYGIAAAASNTLSDWRQQDETWWQEAATQKFYLGNLEYDDSAGSFSFSIALPLPDDPRPPLGVVKAVFNLKAVQEFARSVRIGDAGYLVVISHKGRVLSHPDNRYLFRETKDVPDLAPVASLLSSALRGVNSFSPTHDGKDGTEWMVGHSRLMRPASLGPLNWSVAALVSRDEVISPILTVRASAALAGLVFILAAVPIVSAVSRRLALPLEDLARRADRISQGELEVNLSMPGRNEICRLAGAIAAMVENLKASHRRTLDINASLERTVRERTDELQRKSRQIEAQNRRVMEASRLKSQFLANMSHELRTPLNAVLALSEILANEMSGPLNEEQSKQIVIVNRSGKALLRLINDVLDLSKIEAGRMSFEKAPMSLHSLVTLIADTLRPLAEDKSLSLTAETAPGLPQFIHGDEHKLRQILINLLGNAIKFTERGGVRMLVRHTQEPAAISFVIEDTGIGIPADSFDRIFEEFRQADGSTTRKYGGTGLGLTISKKMAELMGGTLTVESAEGKGSAFTLTVPYELAPPVPPSPTETLRRVRMQIPDPALRSTGDDSATALNDSRPIVLVAEDEQDNLYIMKKYLNRHGCQVVFARDGSEVLQKARTFKPIAITLDLVLPKKNGWDVLSELKTDPETRHIPVIIASVLDNQERGFCLGAYRYLVKPINETDLADTIHQIQWAGRKDVKRVLIIDDNIVDSDLLARLLEENRYDVLRASSGDEGIAAAVREKPDLIMLDLAMPGMDGFQVMEELRKRDETRDIPIVISTAKDLSPGEKERLKRDASRVFLKNPLEPSRILSEIADLLKQTPGSARLPTDTGSTTSTIDQDPRRAAHLVGDACATMPLGSSPNAASSAREEPPGGERCLVMIVEDDAANQYTLECLLRADGYEVAVVENGREALDKIDQIRPDVVLMDMMMPIMGGHEATRALKEMPGIMNIPVIALTAAAMAGDREKALAAGCDDYISKPVNREHLVSRIQHWLSLGREARRTNKPLKTVAPAAALEDQGA